MNMKTVVGVVAALAVVAGGFYFFKGNATAPTVATTNTNDAQQPTFTWSYREQPEIDGAPQTEVSLNGRVVGTYQGTCSEIGGQNSWTLLAGEQTGVICWYAGGGTEIGVFAHEDGGYDVLEGKLDEGSAETPGMRGDFEFRYSL